MEWASEWAWPWTLALACELVSSLAGVWAWASWLLRCHTIPLRGESLRAESECEWAWPLPAESLSAASPCESTASLPAASECQSPRTQAESECESAALLPVESPC